MGTPVLFNLFVTSVEKESHFLKILGQKDQAAATSIERQILQHAKAFDEGLGIPIPQSLRVGLECCARFQDVESYYRAKILGLDFQTNLVQVTYIDYGNTCQVPLSKVRVLDPEATKTLFSIPPQASSFILSEVTGNWDDGALHNILNTIGYEELKCAVVGAVGPLNDVPLLKLYYKGRDYAEILCANGLGIHVKQSQFEVMVNSNLSMKNRTIQPMPGFGNINPYSNQMMNFMNPMWSRMMPNAMAGIPGFVNPAMAGFPTTASPMNSMPNMLFPNIPEVPSFTVRKPCPKPPNSNSKRANLEPNSDHAVTVSNVDDFGAFAVQLKEDEEELLALMTDINSETFVPTPLAPPLLPGTKCLGSYSVDDSLCRAVVVGLEDDKCRLYYTDYGNTEVVDSKDIFELPPKFSDIKSFAVQFSLSGLKEVQPTDEMKEIFKEILRSDQDIILKVCAPRPEESPIKLYCELYINDTDIQELINLELLKKRSKPKLRNMPMPDVGSHHQVSVSFVKSFDCFFVQLASKQAELEELMESINLYCETHAEKFQVSEIALGAPCCALYSADGRWYRAYVVDPAKDSLAVFYVDYGNEEKVTVEDLRRIDPKLTRLRTQAIRCELYGFENVKDQTLADRFEEIALEQTFKMSVVQLRREKPAIVVTLVNESGEDVSALLKSSPNISSTMPSKNFNVDNHRPQSNPDAANRVQNHASTFGRSRNDHSSITAEIPNSNDRNSFQRWDGRGEVNDKRSYRSENANTEERGKGGFVRDQEDKGSRFRREDRFGMDRDAENIAYRPKESNWGSTTENTNGNRYYLHCDRTEVGHDGDADQDRRDRGGRSRPERESSRGGSRGEQSYQKERDWKSNNNQRSSNIPAATSEEKWDDVTVSASRTIEMLSPTIGSSLPVYMVYAISPSDFYVQATGSNELSALMDRISEEYNAGGDVLSASDIKDSAVCVAKYEDEMWYRAVIKKVSGNSVDVFFPDYGNFHTANKADLKKIKDDFTTLKGQAIHCSLIGTPSTGWSDDDIASFSSLSESETLEATFVEACPDMLFKIILKDGSGSSVNENYGATPETMLSPSSVVTTICHQSVTPGSFQDTIVSWLVSPSQFYVQLKQTADEFKSLMQKLQKHYCNKDPLSSAEVGQMVIAKFKDDNSFYRAELKIRKGNKFGVFYVDYGNKSLVDQIYALEHQFAILPSQAILCSLKGVSPIDNSWPKNCSNICELMRGDITCTFHSAGDRGEAAVVSLCCGGSDFAQILIDQNLARSDEIQLTSEIVTEPSPMEEIDLNLLVGQIVPALASACSVSSLFVNFETDQKLLLQEKVQIFFQDPEKLLKLPPEQAVISHQCIAFCEESQLYKRAKIVDSSSTVGVLVQCVDDGCLEEVGTSQIFVLPEEFAAIPPQAIECTFAQTEISADLEEELKTIVSQKIFLDVQKCIEAKLEVHLLSATWQPFPFLPHEAKPMSVCPMPVLRRRMQVCVSHASGTTVWLQQCNQIDALSELLENLFASMEEKESISDKWEKGSICAAKSEDGNWYRGIVEDTTDEGVVIFFVDYGNSETVSVENLKQLSEEYIFMPAFALKASLPLTSLEDSFSVTVMNMTADKVLTAVLEKSEEQQWLVELLEEDAQLSQKLVLTGQAISMENNPFTALLDKNVAQVKVMAGSKQLVFVSVVESPSEVYVQLVERSGELEKLQADLETLSHCMKPFDNFPDVGSRCMALYEDGAWYRGKVLPDQRIFFVDYGNVGSIDISSLKPLAPAVCEVGDFALKCCLLPPEGKLWSENTTSRLNELLIDTSQEVIVNVLTDAGEALGVDISLGGESVADILAMEDLLDDSPIKSECPTKLVFVSYVKSPSKFWVSENDAAAKLEVMDLGAGDDLHLKDENVVCGLLCAALYEDGLWYRAKVEELGEESCIVHFIDYGNTAVTSQLKSLPAQLLSEPPLAKHCALHAPKHEWSEASIARFSELVAGGATLFSMNILVDGDPAIINLTIDGKKIDDELLSLCTSEAQLCDAVINQELSSTVKAYVAFANSPSDFYVHLVEDSSNIKEIDTALLDAENFTSLSDHSLGTICAAKFSEDEKWYRACILSCQENGFEIRFIDYGNSSTSTELRTLPESLQGPPIAKHCTLPVMENESKWSEAAVEKFLEMTGDMATEFEIEFLSSEEPFTVNLLLSGANIACELAELSGVESSAIEQQLTALRNTHSSDVTKGLIKSSTEEGHEENANKGCADAEKPDVTALTSLASQITSVDNLDSSAVELRKDSVAHSEEPVLETPAVQSVEKEGLCFSEDISAKESPVSSAVDVSLKSESCENVNTQDFADAETPDVTALTTLASQITSVDNLVSSAVESKNDFVTHSEEPVLETPAVQSVEKEGLSFSEDISAKESPASSAVNVFSECESCESDMDQRTRLEVTEVSNLNATLSTLSEEADVSEDCPEKQCNVSTVNDLQNGKIVLELLTYPSAQKLEENCSSVSHGFTEASEFENKFDSVEPGIKTYKFNDCDHGLIVEVKTSDSEEEEIQITQTEIIASVLLAESDLLIQDMKNGMKHDQLSNGSSNID